MFKLTEKIREGILKRDAADMSVTSVVFKCHCVLTAAMLFFFSAVLTSADLVSDPIKCLFDKDKDKDTKKFIETYCWITPTYTMPDAYQRQSALAGIGNDFGDEGAKKYYAYYQWVCVVLFLQALMCYVPKFLWNVCEGGLMSSLSSGLSLASFGEKDRQSKKKSIVHYLRHHNELHGAYAFRYFALEALCLVNIVFQMHMMNLFLDGEFADYGLRVLAFAEQVQEQRVDPMVYVFPRVTKCTYHRYGSSGSIQKHDALCVLPLNAVNEKTYIFIWFWFMALAVLLSVLVAYRVLLMASPSLRSAVFSGRHRLVPREVSDAVLAKRDFGDWWLLYNLGDNIDPIIFRDVICDLASQAGERESGVAVDVTHK